MICFHHLIHIRRPIDILYTLKFDAKKLVPSLRTLENDEKQYLTQYCNPSNMYNSFTVSISLSEANLLRREKDEYKAIEIQFGN